MSVVRIDITFHSRLPCPHSAAKKSSTQRRAVHVSCRADCCVLPRGLLCFCAVCSFSGSVCRTACRTAFRRATRSSRTSNLTSGLNRWSAGRREGAVAAPRCEQPRLRVAVHVHSDRGAQPRLVDGPVGWLLGWSVPTRFLGCKAAWLAAVEVVVLDNGDGVRDMTCDMAAHVVVDIACEWPKYASACGGGGEQLPEGPEPLHPALMRAWWPMLSPPPLACLDECLMTCSLLYGSRTIFSAATPQDDAFDRRFALRTKSARETELDAHDEAADGGGPPEEVLPVLVRDYLHAHVLAGARRLKTSGSRLARQRSASRTTSGDLWKP